MGPRSSVKNITYNMKVVDHQPLDQITQCHNKFRCTPYPDNRMNDLIIITFFIRNISLFRNQFFYNISKILGERFPYL